MFAISEISGKKLVVAVGTDHGGFAVKGEVQKLLEQMGHQVVDCGPFVLDPADDYSDFGSDAARMVARKEADAAVLICRSGVGMGIVANRFHGVRAVVAGDEATAKKSREHNASNTLVLPGDKIDFPAMKAIIEAWLATPFSGDERHARRLCKVENNSYDDIAALRNGDPEIAAMIDREADRQNNGIELIASENFASCAVRAAQGSVLTNKYAEGYPGKRYYNGCGFIDEIEQIAIDRACKLFGAEAANVQPHAGSQANMAVYLALVKPGDTVLAMSLDHGGHLTHGHPLNFSGSLYNIVPYGVNRETEMIDYDEIERLAVTHKPKMILAGASAYPRIIDFARLRAIADLVGAKLFVDMAHIAGLVAAGLHPSPVPYADIVTTTTHKTLRGPRGGLILCRQEYAKQVDKAIFPCTQGGPLMHIIAAKAVSFGEALDPSFADYQRQIVSNAATLAERLTSRGIRLVTGGTDNHLMLLDLRGTPVNGRELEIMLDSVHITANKNSIPGDPLGPTITSGLRVGTPAVTSRGMKEEQMQQIGDWIADCVFSFEEKRVSVRAGVSETCRRFPIYE